MKKQETFDGCSYELQGDGTVVIQGYNGAERILNFAAV